MKNAMMFTPKSIKKPCFVTWREVLHTPLLHAEAVNAHLLAWHGLEGALLVGDLLRRGLPRPAACPSRPFRAVRGRKSKESAPNRRVLVRFGP